MEWFDCFIPLHPPVSLDLNKYDAMEDIFHIQVEDELFGEDWLKCFATEILDAKYEGTDVVEVVKGFIHLNAHQKADCFECYRKMTRCSMKHLEFIHIKRYTLTLI
jgi:hypothetical protein